MVDLYETLEAPLRQVHGGDLSPSRAHAMASLARAMVSTMQVGELEERIRMIERMLTDDLAAS